MSKSNKNTSATNDKNTSATVTEIKKPTAIKYSAIGLNWSAKGDKAIPVGISKSKMAILAVCTGIAYKLPAINLIIDCGFNVLKNTGSATSPDQRLIKDTDRQSVSWIQEFTKCVNGIGNTKTMSCYINGLAKMQVSDIEFYSKRVATTLKATPATITSRISIELVKLAKQAKTA